MQGTAKIEIEWVTAQARLLSDRELRDAFRKDPDSVAVQLNIAECERPLFVRLNADQLEAQAVMLVEKRLHEVRQAMPGTFSNLGRAGRSLFLEYADTFWPEGHRRHLVDAVHFANHLLANRVAPVCQTEINWLRFSLHPVLFRMHSIRHRTSGGRDCPGLQILTFRKGRVGQFVFYGVLPWRS